MHKNKGKSVAKCLKLRIDYIINPEKTDGGKLVSSYMCDADIAAEQFLLSKKLYAKKTGREQADDVIAYQVRQAFKPDEITPELANKIGYELAEKITKGNHAFIVATHIDKAHIHNHIIWNSTKLDSRYKFRNFWNSAKAIAKISDLLCLKNNLSIVEDPKDKSKHYGEWLGDEKPLNQREQLKKDIDEILAEKPSSFDEFLSKMRDKGYAVKYGKHLGFVGAGKEKCIRLRSLKDGYLEADIRAVIEGKSEHKPTKLRQPKIDDKVNLVRDLQKALMEKGKGYESWTKTYNLKQMAKAVNYITENNLLDYAELTAKADSVNMALSSHRELIKNAEKRMAENALLQKYIFQFARTKETYDKYKASGYSAKFKEENIAEILLHQAAKNHFKSLDLLKLPKVKDLKVEYAELLASKKKAYKTYSDLNEESKEVLNAKRNVEILLEIDNSTTEKEKQKDDKSL